MIKVWCNRAMLAAGRRPATGLSKPESIGGGGNGGDDRDSGEGRLVSFLHVIQHLMRDPEAVGAVLVDGTAAVPARYLCSSSAADEDAHDGGGKGGGVESDCLRRSRDLERSLNHDGPAASNGGDGGNGVGEGGRGLAVKGSSAENSIAKDAASSNVGSSSGGGAGLGRQSSGRFFDASNVAGEDLTRENVHKDTWHRSPWFSQESFVRSREHPINRNGNGENVGYARRVFDLEQDHVGARTTRRLDEGNQEYVYLNLLVQNALELLELEDQLQQHQRHDRIPNDPAAVRETDGGSIGEGNTILSTSPKRQNQHQRHHKPLPEVDLYIGALELALGVDLEVDPSSPAASVSDSGDGPSLRVADPAAVVTGAGAKMLGDGGIGVGGNSEGREPEQAQVIGTNDGRDGGAVGGGGVSTGKGDAKGDSSPTVSSVGAAAAVAVPKIGKATWPPPYILDNFVQQTQRKGVGQLEEGENNNREDQGLVIVTNVNCGYLDMAVNFLLSVRRAEENIKVRKVGSPPRAFLLSL